MTVCHSAEQARGKQFPDGGMLMGVEAKFLRPDIKFPRPDVFMEPLVDIFYARLHTAAPQLASPALRGKFFVNAGANSLGSSVVYLYADCGWPLCEPQPLISSRQTHDLRCW